jgi:hypothetical protein
VKIPPPWTPPLESGSGAFSIRYVNEEGLETFSLRTSLSPGEIVQIVTTLWEQLNRKPEPAPFADHERSSKGEN